MKSEGRFYLLLVLSFSLVLSGCVVRTYRTTRDRVDQGLNIGNRGYLMSNKAIEEPTDRKATRTTQIVELELHSPIKFEKAPKEKTIVSSEAKKSEDESLWGNRGYITESVNPELNQGSISASTVNLQKYTVAKSDTLQKISKKFYGTTKKWAKIYDANKDVLKGPNKIYPGQVINIPVEEVKVPQGNLK